MAGGHCLQKRTRSYSSERNRWNASKDKFYRGLCEDNNCKRSTDRLHKKSTSKSSVLKGTSKQWMRAQKNIEAVKKLKCCGLRVRKKPIRLYVVFQPNKSKIKTEEDLDMANDGLDSDATIVLNTNTPSEIKQEDPVLKCSIKTKTFSLKKPDLSSKGVRKRNYRCPVCKVNHGTLAVLNKHYKLHHSPLSCKDCAQEFCTPSALERHGYKHRKLKYNCDDCGKRFPFESDCTQHHLSHQTVKHHHCSKPGCTRNFYSKGDLTKHEKMHLKKMWKCELCPYMNKDQQNLKAHLRVHSNLKRYICPNCSKLFQYHMQLSRHIPSKEKVPKDNIDSKPSEPHPRSRSLEY